MIRHALVTASGTLQPEEPIFRVSSGAQRAVDFVREQVGVEMESVG